MASKLVLADIEALAAGGAYAGTYTLSDATVALVLSWLALLFHWNWIGAGYSLTSIEIDTIDDMIAEALTELMEVVEVNGLELGAIMPFAGDTLPDKYLWCDGATHEKDDYPDLYAALDDAFIIDFAFFKTPFLSARVPLGVGAFVGGEYVMGEVGGDRIVTLTEAEMPEHTHGIPYWDSGADVGDNLHRWDHLLSTKTYRQQSDAAGSGDAHENMMPFQAVNYIIYAGV